MISFTLSQVLGGFSIYGLFVLLFKKGDDLLSDEARAAFSGKLKEVLSGDIASKVDLNFMGLYFGPQVGYLRFFLNTLYFTIGAMVLLTILFLVYAPGPQELYVFNDPEKSKYVQEWIAQGGVSAFAMNLVFVYLPIAWVANYFSFELFSRKISGKYASNEILYATFAIDMFVKIVIITILLLMVFAIRSGEFGSGGFVAVKTVFETMWSALKFGDESAIALYSVPISSFPLYLLATISLLRRSAGLRKLVSGIVYLFPFDRRPVRALSMISGALFVSFILISGFWVLLVRWIFFT